MSQTAWEADKMLDVYIHDYLMKRKLHNTAKVFQAEGKVATDSVAIHAPGGFLFEWWSVFWDIFIARTNSKHSEAATSYIETQKVKAREQQSMQHQHQQQKPPSQHSQMQQLQQRRDGTQDVNRAYAADALIGNDQLMRQSPSNANAVGDDGAMKRRFGVNNVNQIIDPSVLKAAALAGQVPGQILISGPIPENLQQSPRIRNHQPQQLPNVGTPLTEMNNMTMDIIGSGPDVSLPSIHGQNQGGNNLTLKGWPLTGMEKLRPGVIPQGIPLLQSPQSFTQLQQQLWLQSQQNLASPSSANDVESARLRMLLSGHLNSVGKTPNVGSPNQLSFPPLPRVDSETLLKIQQMQNNNQQHQHYSQHQLSSQTPQSSNHQIRQQERIIGVSNVTADGIMSTSFQGNDQASKSQAGRKRKQQVSSSGPANSSGTANTTGPSPSSPSTPSTHTPADAISMPTMAHTGGGGSSKSLLMFGSDGLGQLTTASNQLANIDGFEDEASLEDNVESFMSQDDAEPRDRVNRCADVSKGFSFSEVRVIPASASKIECCHFSSDGKLLATGGHDRKALLWCTDSYTVKSSLEEHSQWLTDVRFSHSATRLATSSADKTVRVWDADNPGFSIRTFTGHSSTVMSLDFHPNKEDLISSCETCEIRYWSVKNGSCVGVSKGGATQVRFQPCFGRTLAAAADNYVSLLDVETHVCRLKLQGHKSLVHSVCWDSSGEYLASVSNDLVRVWKVGSGNRGEHAYELSSTGNKFNTCVFHPTFPILMIGCYETLEIWNMSENKTMSIHAHDNLVSALAVSKTSGLVASASHDKCVKLWN